MLKSQFLTRRQKGVLEDLFSGLLNVQEVLEKWKLRRRTYHRWHTQPFFSAEFKRLLALKQSESELVLAHYSPDVAAKLVTLTGAEKEETARKACADIIINHPNLKAKNRVESNKPPVEEEELVDIPPEIASRLLAALADEKRRIRSGQQTASKDFLKYL